MSEELRIDFLEGILKVWCSSFLVRIVVSLEALLGRIDTLCDLLIVCTGFRSQAHKGLRLLFCRNALFCKGFLSPSLPGFKKPCTPCFTLIQADDKVVHICHSLKDGSTSTPDSLDYLITEYIMPCKLVFISFVLLFDEAWPFLLSNAFVLKKGIYPQFDVFFCLSAIIVRGELTNFFNKVLNKFLTADGIQCFHSIAETSHIWFSTLITVNDQLCSCISIALRSILKDVS